MLGDGVCWWSVCEEMGTCWVMVFVGGLCVRRWGDMLGDGVCWWSVCEEMGTC